MLDPSRRSFLRGRPRPQEQIRPPWALAEALFVDRCTRCNDCLKACPQKILVAGDGGYPTVDFGRAECTFCGECLAVCQPRALRRVEGELPWHRKALINDTCLARRGVECRVCADYCAVAAIRFAPRLGGNPRPEIDSATCTGCGACVGPCPTRAITIL